MKVGNCLKNSSNIYGKLSEVNPVTRKPAGVCKLCIYKAG
jgi:hypothetical protein